MTGPVAVDIISLAVLIVVLVSAVSVVVQTLKNGVPPMPSVYQVRRSITGIAGRFAGTGIVVELGSAWGTLAVSLSRACPSATVVGYENSLAPYVCSLLLRSVSGRRNLRLVRADFRGISLRDAGVVVCYLSGDAMSRLKPKFEAELRTGAVVVSSTFAVPGWNPSETVRAEDLYRTPVYVYRPDEVADNRAGRRLDLDV